MELIYSRPIQESGLSLYVWNENASLYCIYLDTGFEICLENSSRYFRPIYNTFSLILEDRSLEQPKLVKYTHKIHGRGLYFDLSQIKANMPRPTIALNLVMEH